MEREIHHIEISDQVLHDRLCYIIGVELPYVLALEPGKVNLAKDVCAYTMLSAEQQKVSLAKSNWKRFLRIYAHHWKTKGIEVDLAISLGAQLGRQKCMMKSLPAFHAQRLENIFGKAIGYGGVMNITREYFDPYVLAGLNSWMFEFPVEEAA